jgi:hypothetical protein
MVHSVRCAAVSSSHHTGRSIDPTRRQLTGKLNHYILFKLESRLLNMYDSILFVLQTSQSSQTPSMQWRGYLVTGAPPTWLPPSSAGFWPPSNSVYWRPPLQSYSGQPRGPPPPQTGQSYWPPPPPWGSPPRGQASSPP